MHTWRANLLISLALVAATVIAYAPALQNDFVNFDDDLYVTDNRPVLAGLTAGGLGWAWTTLHAGYFQPLTWMSLQLDAQLYGRRPAGYHLTNVLLHAANVVLLFWVLRRLTGATWRSAAVAGLFALHPLHVESVAWVTERKDVLSTFFGLLTIAAYRAYARSPRLARYLPVVAALTLGLLAKPMLVTLPCVLLLLDYWPLQRVDRGRLRLSTSAQPQAVQSALLLEKLPLLFLAAAAAAVTVFAQYRVRALEPLARLPFGARLENALVGYVWYLAKTIWPSDLAPFYPHPGGTLPWWQVAGAAALLLALTAAALAAARQRPYLAVGWLWFLLTLLPVIGLAQAGEQPVADRFAYWPHVGLVLLLVWGAHDFLAAWRVPQVVRAAGAAAVLLACAAATWVQACYWHDSVTLLEHTLQVTTANTVAENTLGAAFLRQGSPQLAIRHFAAALEADPANRRAHYNLGLALLQQGRRQDAARQFAEALRIDPGFAPAHYDWGVALIADGQREEAIAHFREALALDPTITPAQHNWGVALAEEGRRDEAVVHFREALRLDPDFVPAHVQLGQLLLAAGDLDEAESHFRAALRVAPNDAAIHYHLGRVLERQQKSDEAAASFREAARLQPRSGR
jgi:tetratricopeptide (TPR) repeat protein